MREEYAKRLCEAYEKETSIQGSLDDVIQKLIELEEEVKEDFAKELTEGEEKITIFISNLRGRIEYLQAFRQRLKDNGIRF